MSIAGRLRAVARVHADERRAQHALIASGLYGAHTTRAGVVWQNTYNRFDPTAAFGGYKESGFGREGGPSGLLPYVRLG